MSDQRVGVVGDATLVGAVEAAGGEPIVVDLAGGEPGVGDLEDDGPVTDTAGLADIPIVVTASEDALVDVVRWAVERSLADAPAVLAVDVEGVGAVSASDLQIALERYLAGDVRTVRHPVVRAKTQSTAVAALFDVALVAAEPARISEFSVHWGEEPVDRFRADGVVASTPAGSVGYNRAAGGPLVAPESDVLSVVPIAPFATHADRWVLPTEGLRLAVERDETPVELLADGRTELSVSRGDPVDVVRSGDLEVVVVPESEPPLHSDF